MASFSEVSTDACVNRDRRLVGGGGGGGGVHDSLMCMSIVFWSEKKFNNITRWPVLLQAMHFYSFRGF